MQIIGHRGAKGLAPENTLVGIEYALKTGVDWIEFDVHATKDGQLVVLHDRTLRRAAKKYWRVKSLTFTQLRQVATTSGEAIPTFAEVMKAIGKRAKVDIELKSAHTAQKVVAEIQRQVADGRPYTDFVVSSFRPWLLADVQRLDRRVPLLLLQSVWPFLFLSVPGLKLSGVAFWRWAAPKSALTLAGQRGLWRVVYVVNTKRRAKLLKKRGVDAIVTDVPGQL